MKPGKIAASVLSISLLVPVLTASSQGSVYAQFAGNSDTEGVSEVDPTNRDSGSNEVSPEVDSTNPGDVYSNGTRVACDDINSITPGAANTACSNTERDIQDLTPTPNNAFPTNNIRDTADQFDLDPSSLDYPSNPNSSGIVNLDSSSAFAPFQPDSVIIDVVSEVDPIKLDAITNDVFSEAVSTNSNNEYGGGTRVACDAVANTITPGAADTACLDAAQEIQDLNAATDNTSTTNSIRDAADQFAPSAAGSANPDSGTSNVDSSAAGSANPDSGTSNVDSSAAGSANPDSGIDSLAPSAVDPINPDSGIDSLAPSAVDPINPDSGIDNLAPSTVDPINPDSGIDNLAPSAVDPINPDSAINEGLTDFAPTNPNAEDGI